MELTVISTFAGVGGSTLGYKMAGFKGLLAIEQNKIAVKNFKLNFPEIPVWQKDICKCKGNEILDFCKIKKGELDILDGSPPCQGFSLSGARKITDTRNDLYLEFIRLINELQPKVFVMENVPGMITGKMKGKFIEIMISLKKLNYNVKCNLMNSVLYEVPQARKRLIFIGIRKDLNIEPSFPIPIKKIITVGEALKNVPNGLQLNEIKGQVGIMVQKLKPNKAGNSVTGFKYYNWARLSYHKPCRTIMANVRLIYPAENRYLSIPELKRLASFPDDFKLEGGFQQQWKLIGNAVMPKFMYHIANNIKCQLKEYFKNKK